MQDSCNLQLTSNNEQNDELRGYLFANKNSPEIIRYSIEMRESEYSTLSYQKLLRRMIQWKPPISKSYFA